MGQKVFFILGVCLLLVAIFFGLTFISKNQKTVLPDAEFVNRKYAIFKDLEAQRAKNRPFLVKIVLSMESRDEALFDVIYFVPENDRRVYRIGIYPDSNNFESSSEVLLPGYNAARVSVKFRPKSIFVRARKTEYLDVNIHANSSQIDPISGEAEINKLYERRAIFSKHWKKNKRNLGTIKSTNFHWK